MAVFRGYVAGSRRLFLLAAPLLLLFLPPVGPGHCAVLPHGPQRHTVEAWAGSGDRNQQQQQQQQQVEVEEAEERAALQEGLQLLEREEAAVQSFVEQEQKAALLALLLEPQRPAAELQDVSRQSFEAAALSQANTQPERHPVETNAAEPADTPAKVFAPKHFRFQDFQTGKTLNVFFHNYLGSSSDGLPCASFDGDASGCSGHPRCTYTSEGFAPASVVAEFEAAALTALGLGPLPGGRCVLDPSYLNLLANGSNCEMSHVKDDELMAVAADLVSQDKVDPMDLMRQPLDVCSLIRRDDELTRAEEAEASAFNVSQEASELAFFECSPASSFSSSDSPPFASPSPSSSNPPVASPGGVSLRELLTSSSGLISRNPASLPASATACRSSPISAHSSSPSPSSAASPSPASSSVLSRVAFVGSPASSLLRRSTSLDSPSPFSPSTPGIASSKSAPISWSEFMASTASPTAAVSLPASSASYASSSSSSIGVGINGFGRIGRLALRVAMGRPSLAVRHINCSMPPSYMAYLLKYDSAHGRYKGQVEFTDDALVVDGRVISVSNTRQPHDIPWKDSGVEYVVEATGAFCTTELAKAHCDRPGGASRVVLSAPAKDEATPTLVMGVNASGTYDPSTMSVVSCASCTTNGLAPLVKVLDDNFGLVEGLLTTVHAATSSQQVVDGKSNKDWRGGRAAGANIIPSATGAAKAVAKCMPHMKGKLTGMAFRVPTLDVSVVDLTCRLAKSTTYEAIKSAVKEAAEGQLRGIVGYTEEPVVSQDFIGETCSTVFDASAGIMLNPNFVKLVSWYDNEFGYCNRLIDLIAMMAAKDATQHAHKEVNAHTQIPVHA
eukprot:GHVT01081572.1.p1 GENE.GHVT01081572.1~~GHVT01081572.1.p1  ORF type:complete len:843 (+),score=241.15 GHVT01081572.1:346-2874(+)